MDGKSPSSAIPRLCIAVGLAVLCWIALWVWTPGSAPVELLGPNESEEITLLVPPGQPLIDWSLFRFPALEVSLEGLDNSEGPAAGNLLDLLEPMQVPSIAESDEGFSPSLELDWNAEQQLLPQELDLLSAAASGSDEWFPANGANHPWSVFGLNTSRVWSEVGRSWSFHAPSQLATHATKRTIVTLLRIDWSAPAKPLNLVGPQLVTSADDRLAMVPIESMETSATVVEPLQLAEPTALLAQIEMLASYPWIAPWANEADREIRRLCSGSVCDAGELAATLEHLSRLTQQARQMAEAARDPATQSELMQAYHGLSRRMNRWQLAADLHQRRTNLWARRSTHRRLLAMIDGGTLASSDPAVVETLRDAVTTGRPLTAEQRRALSQAILSGERLAHRSSDSAASLSGALDEELRLLATDSVDVRTLFANLESLESTGNPLMAAEIAASQRQLGNSADERQRQLATEIEEHYRNANFRVAVSGDLLNRWLPEQPAMAMPVRDRIAGSPVRGQSRTQTDLFVRLIPDAFIWRVGLEASGEVATQATSGDGSVSVRTEGATTFLARKLFLVRADGVQSWAAVANADASQRLVGISSSYDQVPLMGSYVRSQANEQYHQRREQARREVEIKTANSARQALDEQATKWLSDIEQKVRSRVLQQAEELELQITPIELRTTDTRLIARLRMANENQLSAYTPRPQAPADSMLSVQLHETAINNALLGLKLSSRLWTAEELAEMLADKLGLPSTELPDAARRTRFHFDSEGAHARFVEGRLHLTLAVREMFHDRSSVRDFKVHVYYRPEIEGLSAKLVRDGSLQMEGRLRHSDRARLHAVFGKALGEDRKLELVRLPADADSAQRLAGLMVTQLVIDDGWLGLSIGPEIADRTAVRTRFVR